MTTRIKAQEFGDSFIGTGLRIDDRDWVVVRSYPGDSGAEDDCYLVIRTANQREVIHYQDYDEGEIAGGYGGDPLAGKLIEYPDGEPPSVTERRRDQKEVDGE